MYWLFAAKGWEPSRWYNMTPGEQDLVWALTSCYLEQEKQARLEQALQAPSARPVKRRRKRR